MARFTLTIELEDAAMRDPGDVAQALEQVAAEVRDWGFGDHPILDINGNTVGRWKATEPKGDQ